MRSARTSTGISSSTSAVIYDGIWVGRDSKVPNLDGIRRQFVEDMKRIGAPNYRWPGGCFADEYHWRDGIGRGARPRTYNYWQDRMPPGLDHTENNQFGIHEFIRLCRLTGAEPYLAANVGSGTAQMVEQGGVGAAGLVQGVGQDGDPAEGGVVVNRRRNSTIGCSTATLRPTRCRWRPNARPTATPSRSA